MGGTGRRTGNLLEIFHAVSVAFSDGDGGAIYLDHFRSIGFDPADGDDKGTMDAFEELGGEKGFDLMGTHFGNVFAPGGDDLDVFPLAFDVGDVGKQDFHFSFLDGNKNEVSRIGRIGGYECFLCDWSGPW